MKAINWFKKIFISLLGLFFIVTKFGSAEENKKQESDTIPPTKEEEQAKANFSKDDLIKSLKNMNRHPEEIETICAMCYEASADPNEMEFQCETCGHITIYPTESDQGTLTGSLSYIKRSQPFTIEDRRLQRYCIREQNEILAEI